MSETSPVAVVSGVTAAVQGETLLDQGWTALRRDDWRRAEQHFHRALAIGQAASDPEDLAVAARLGLAHVRYSEGDPGLALAEGLRALADAAGRADHYGWEIPLHQLLADTCAEVGAPQRSIGFRLSVIRLLRGETGADSFEVAEACYQLGETLLALGVYGGAAAGLAEAVRILEMYQPEERRSLMEVQLLQARALARAGRFDDAEAVFQSLLPLMRRVRGEGSAEEAALWTNRGAALAAQKRFSEAGAMFERANMLRAADPETTPERMAILWSYWSALLRAEGNLARARDLAERAVRALEEAVAPARYLAFEALGRAIEEQGDYVKAETVCRRALERMRRDGVLDLFEFSRMMLWHAALLDRNGREQEGDEARARASEAIERLAKVPALDAWTPASPRVA